MPDVSTPSQEYELMRLARILPEMLDSQRPEGGVMRLLTDPGGRIDNLLSAPAAGTSSGIELDASSAVDRMVMLIQHAHELDQDFSFRAMITAPDNAYWHSVESLAGRPFVDGVTLENVPPILDKGGEWYEDVDLQGNSIPAFLSRHARYSAGYGFGYIGTFFHEERKRPWWKWVPGEAVTRVIPGSDGPDRIHVKTVMGGVFEEGEPDVNQLPKGEPEFLVYRAAGEGRPEATVENYPKLDGSYKAEPDNVLTLDGQTSIPLDPMATGPLSASHFIQPLLLPAAALDYQLLQVSSNNRYGQIIANTFLRFAKGLKEGEIENWLKVGPRLFYASESPDADMKWVTIDPGAVKSGPELEDHIKRQIEVAGLSPMMTRMPGDEKATGQSIAAARARSAMSSVVLAWESNSSTALGRLVGYSTGPKEGDVPKVVLAKETGLSPEKMEEARFLATLYLDPKGGMERPEFWEKMAEIGISTPATPEDLAKWAEQANPERQALLLDRARVGMSALAEGELPGVDGRASVYRALAEARAIVPPPNIKGDEAVEAWILELAAQSPEPPDLGTLTEPTLPEPLEGEQPQED